MVLLFTKTACPVTNAVTEAQFDNILLSLHIHYNQAYVLRLFNESTDLLTQMSVLLA